jgi:cobalt-zinc-cadmium efflux system protein
LNEAETHLEADIDFDSNIMISEFEEILSNIDDILYKKF